MVYKAKDTAMINADSAFTNKLNKFFTCFEVSQVASANYRLPKEDSDIISKERMISIAEDDVRVALRRVNTRKAAGPDGITSCLLCCYSDQLAGVFAFIINKSLAKFVVPTCFKRSTIISITKYNKSSCLADYWPVALTSNERV